jgi:hypothetical protein
MSNAEYKATLQAEQGSLLFPGNYYDCSRLVDKKEVRNNFFDELKDKRITHILVHTDTSPGFKNKANRDIPYKYSVCASKDQDGADLEMMCGRLMYVCHQPVGDAIIVYAEVKVKDQKKADLSHLKTKMKKLKAEIDWLEDVPDEAENRKSMIEKMAQLKAEFLSLETA